MREELLREVMDAGLITCRLARSSRVGSTHCQSRTQQSDFSRLAFRRVTPVAYRFSYARLTACAVSQIRVRARVPVSIHQKAFYATS